MRREFAQVTGWPTPAQRLESSALPATPARGKTPDPNTRTAAQLAAVAVFLPYCLFESFELGF